MPFAATAPLAGAAAACMECMGVCMARWHVGECPTHGCQAHTPAWMLHLVVCHPCMHMCEHIHTQGWLSSHTGMQGCQHAPNAHAPPMQHCTSATFHPCMPPTAAHEVAHAVCIPMQGKPIDAQSLHTSLNHLSPNQSMRCDLQTQRSKCVCSEPTSSTALACPTICTRADRKPGAASFSHALSSPSADVRTPGSMARAPWMVASTWWRKYGQRCSL